MQTTRILQAVVLMMIVALAASCAASKEYSSKLFNPRNENSKDSQLITPRFLELENLQSEKEGWVTTDIIMGRDTVSKTLALDNLAKVFPASPIIKDSAAITKNEKPEPVIVETKPIPVTEQPVARINDPETIRNKRTRDH